MTPCYFRQWAKDPCRGWIDPCHILPKRVIKIEHAKANPRTPSAWDEPSPLTGTDLQDLLADRRNIVLGCRHHHSNADAGKLPYVIPESARTFAAEIGLAHRLP